MSSSDSEDDSFLNPTQKLNAMMNNYKADNDCNFNDSVPLSVPTTSTSPSKNKKTTKSPAKKRKKSTDSCSSGSIDLEDFNRLYPPIKQTLPKRNTRARRSRAKLTASAQSSPNLVNSQKVLPKRKSRKSNADSTLNSTNATAELGTASTREVEPPQPPNPARGRGRGRARARGRGRGRNNSNSRQSRNMSILDILQAMITVDSVGNTEEYPDQCDNQPVYSVGNTAEYPDQCDNQQLFSNNKSNDVIEIEDLNETLEENELMSVKVEWMSANIFKFGLRKYQKLSQIFDFFSTEENISYDKLYFSYNGKIIRPDDTPDSIDYSIAKFIEGGIVSHGVAPLTSNNEIKDGIKLKFQCQNVKRPFEIIVKPDDKLATAMLQCAEHFEHAFEKLKFEFDGDIITGKSTPRELDLEGGGCIDVKILN